MMSATVPEIVNKLSTLLDLQYIFRSEVWFKDQDKSLFIVIMEGNCSSVSLELSYLVAQIFQDETHFLYRIFPYAYTLQQLKDGNLFFVHGCTSSHLIYTNSNQDTQLFGGYVTGENTLIGIEMNFKKEKEKIGGFMDGADFFLENGNISQSAFLLHQVIELLFRTVELFTMGKERKSHSIKEHQNYIKLFVPELGRLFDVQTEGDLFLLKLLDEAYIGTRYGISYPINKEQLRSIRKKADDMYDIVVQLFEERVVIYSMGRTKQDVPESIPSKTDTTGSFSHTEKLATIEAMVQSHFKLLKPYENREGLYKIILPTEGYLETSFMVSNLLKVCILALYAEESSERSIPQPAHNVQEVLKYILELIPLEEMELLDNLRDLV